ncbi:hypothetical protein CDAR_492071 [Caerostris darwini]|uniref:Uncharacterized protein n=1 Tax=Caerostris darwini TaxID=1538125 RepID=A0AAV4VLW7_9ARAC|nr:hypothetical protein CDAR_492071 [Caerostris darwini]
MEICIPDILGHDSETGQLSKAEETLHSRRCAIDQYVAQFSKFQRHPIASVSEKKKRPRGSAEHSSIENHQGDEDSFDKQCDAESIEETTYGSSVQEKDTGRDSFVCFAHHSDDFLEQSNVLSGGILTEIPAPLQLATETGDGFRQVKVDSRIQQHDGSADLRVCKERESHRDPDDQQKFFLHLVFEGVSEKHYGRWYFFQGCIVANCHRYGRCDAEDSEEIHQHISSEIPLLVAYPYANLGHHSQRSSHRRDDRTVSEA